MEPEDLLDIALRIEDIIIRLERTADRIENILEYYENEGEKERGAGFEAALARLEGAISRLEEIKLGLSERADSLTDDDRRQVIIDIKSIKSIVRDVAIDILSGGRRRTETNFRERSEFRGSADDFMNAIKHCDEFSKENTFEFSPEPQTRVVLQGLDNDKCIFIMHFPGGEVKFLLPPKAYQFFNGPQTLLLDDVECSPEVVCKMFKEKFASFATQERFGEREFREKFKNGEFEREFKYKSRFGKEFREEFEEEREYKERFGEDFNNEFRERFEQEFKPEEFENQQKEFYDQQRERLEEETKNEENKDDFIIENTLEKYGDQFREEEK